MASIPSFIFGGNTKYKTQEELEAAREAVRAMLGDIGHSGLTGWGSALADLGSGIRARIDQGRIDEGQAELLERQAPFSQTLAEITGGGYGGDIATAGGSDTAAGGGAQDEFFANPGSAVEASNYLRYANQGATRNKPLAPKLEQALSFLGDLGVTAEVFSGGQESSGPRRTGSHRHDEGNAGDIRFYKDGRQLSWSNKEDLPLFQEIVRQGKARGITGFGAGPGYMGEGSMHVGFGTPAVWGAGGSSKNAPGWLRDAYSGGSNNVAGGVGTDPANDAFTRPPPSSGGMAPYRDAIASIESAGSGDYAAVGRPDKKLGRPLGRYQIMEKNIGPWSKKHLGREVTPQEFLQNPAIQDAIFDGEFGGYVKKYGREGAAQAWLGGPGAVGKRDREDALGTSVGEYGRRFTANLGGGAGDSFLQAKPRRRMTPAMLEQEAGTEARPIWDNGFNLQGRRRMTPAMTGIPDTAPSAAPSPLDGRRRMTPAMINPAAAPAPAPMPAPDPARFGPTPPVPVAAPVPMQAPDPNRFGPPPLSSLPPRAGVGIFASRPEHAYVPPAPQIFTPPAAPRGNRLGSPLPSMAGTETAPYPVPGNSMAGTETAPPQFAPTPAQPPVPTARPAVDPFTDMILGDQAKNFRPGGYIPPAPVGQQVFPTAPPAPGTPAAAGFGVPPVVGGGGPDQLAGKGTFPPAPPAPGQQGGGDKIAKLQFILASPYASKEQKLMAGAMIEREYALEDERRKANTPEAQIDFKIKQAQLAGLLNKDDVDDVVVVGKRLYNKKTKEWIDPPASGEGKGPFSTESVEGQALNGLVEMGKLTVEQAYDLASGKTITNPDGSIMFFTGTQLVGGQPGQPPQPIQPDAPVGGAPAPQAPPEPQAAPAPSTAQSPGGGRQLTPAKAEKPTEAQLRDRSLYSVILPEMKIVEDNFDALSDPVSQLADQVPGGAMVANPQYQQAATALRSFISSYLYSMSGAEAKTSEIETNFALLRPRNGEPEASKADKKRRLRTMAEAIRVKGTTVGGGGVPPPPDTSNAGPRKTKTGITWSAGN